MNKEQLLLELNNLVNSIPKEIADKDYNQRYNQANELQKTIESTENELIDVQNKLDGLDEGTSFELISKESEIREEENNLNLDELALRRFQAAVTNFEGEISGDESTLESLDNLDMTSESIITNIENLIDSPNPEISENARKRLERLERERAERRNQRNKLEEIIRKKKEKLEEKRKLSAQYEENINKRREHIQTLKDQLEEFKTENADKITTDDTLRRIELQNRLVALRQAHTILTINPVLEMQYIISEYEKDLIDQAEVARRLEPLKAALSVTNFDADSREKELEQISKLKAEVEEKIRESEAALADVNNTFSKSNRELKPHQTYEAEEARREKFSSEIRKLDIQDYQDEQKRKANVAEIMENEDLIDVARSEIRDIEQDIEAISNTPGITEEEKARQVAPYARELQVLNNDIVSFEQDNASLKLNNEQMALDKDSRSSKRDRYQKQIELINLKSKIDRGDRNVELIDLQSYKSELSALNLREQYIKLSIADRFDALLNKLPKNRIQEESKLNKTQQDMYDKILAGLPLEDRKKAIEKSKEFDQKEEPENNPDLNPEIKEPTPKKDKNKPTPIVGFRHATKKLGEKLRDLWVNKKWFKRAIAVLLTAATLVTVGLLINKENHNLEEIKDIPAPPTIEQPVEEEPTVEGPEIVIGDEDEKTPQPDKPDKPQPDQPSNPQPDQPDQPVQPDQPDQPDNPEPPAPSTPAPGEYNFTLDPTIENPGENNFPESEAAFITVDGVSGNIDAYGTARFYPANGGEITIYDVATTTMNSDGTFNVKNINYDKIKAELNRTEKITNPLPPTGEEVTAEEAEEQVKEGTRDAGEQENADQAADDIFKELEELLNGTGGTQLTPATNLPVEQPTEDQPLSR